MIKNYSTPYPNTSELDSLSPDLDQGQTGACDSKTKDLGKTEGGGGYTWYY